MKYSILIFIGVNIGNILVKFVFGFDSLYGVLEILTYLASSIIAGLIIPFFVKK